MLAAILCTRIKKLGGTQRLFIENVGRMMCTVTNTVERLKDWNTPPLGFRNTLACGVRRRFSEGA